MSILILILSCTLLSLGMLSTFIPILPGTFIAWLGVFLHKLVLMDESSIPWTFVFAAAALTLLAQLLDILLTWWGARRFGASWVGAAGAILGGTVGTLFFSLPGLILGPVIGAIAFEILNDRSFREAGRAGFGTIVGGLAAFGLKFAFTLIIVGGFFYYL